ncbi:glycosome import protein (gim1), putative [Trypanosoma brucei gambiense DAL972]|uniref:Peroxin-2 n=2 Tax=Trypanosoma brucei TaxID=5691 RepID=C9ZKD0_TRYB9|nr:glycosome import protein (gim1), putative [Trypanosoma brucei gambiense DAL972]CAC59701.1 peroxin-2 [Trypanosoma brucei]CBH09894.1 glycosome import protein (gim1), putative [Trypanosoma brucei gambiense DAL972]|eukprot:XP_011772187.1 glycosome import protein (gim1), putative [Trypanosoma brucei gambiense DAL972]
MAWITDAAVSQFPLATVLKQQGALPTSNMFTALPENRVLRIFQLNALTTQEEVVEILRGYLLDIFNIGALQSYRYVYQDEFSFLLDVILFFGSTWRCGQSVGDRMQNLVLRNEIKALESGQSDAVQLVHSLVPSRARLLLYGVLNLFVPYLFRKLQRRALEEGWEDGGAGVVKRKLAKLLKAVSVSWMIISLLHTLHFLATAQYRTPVERMLSLRLVYGSQDTRRFTNLIYLNQHIFWQIWSSFISVLNIGRYTSRVTRFLQAFTAKPGNPSLTDNACSACHNKPTLPQRSNCGHLYCYYCIKSRLLGPGSAKSFRCLRCGTVVSTTTPWAQ